MQKKFFWPVQRLFKIQNDGKKNIKVSKMSRKTGKKILKKFQNLFTKDEIFAKRKSNPRPPKRPNGTISLFFFSNYPDFQLKKSGTFN